MIKLLLGNAVWQLIIQMDVVSKLVLITLLIMSVTSWTIFLYKLMMIRHKKKQLDDAVERIKKATTVEQMLAVASDFSGTLPGYFLSKNLMVLKDQLETKQFDPSVSLSKEHRDIVQDALMQTLDECMYRQESYLPFLSTSAAVGPLLGLFGTVWGLIHVFVNISQKQSADIAAVAPGMAEALINTLAGLIVAVPALVMFNYLHVRVRTIEEQLVKLAERFMLIVHRTLMR